jgi:hypothetical protein
LLLIDFFDESTETVSNYHFKSEECDLKLDVDDIKSAFFFKLKFDEHYWSLLKKYRTLTDEQWDLLNQETEDYKDQLSLTYHLKKRGILPADTE